MRGASMAKLLICLLLIYLILRDRWMLLTLVWNRLQGVCEAPCGC